MNQAGGTRILIPTAVENPRRAVIVAYIVVFLAFTDNFSMFPTIGPYTQYLGGGAFAMGAAVAAYSVTNLLFNIFGGIMLDRSGRRRLLLAGTVAAAVSMFLYGAVTDVTGLIVVRFVHGAAGGILVPAVFTTIADLAPARSSGRAMGRAGALIGATAILSPAMAGILRQTIGFNAVFLVGGTLLVAGALLTALALPETAGLARAKDPKKARSARDQSPVESRDASSRIPGSRHESAIRSGDISLAPGPGAAVGIWIAYIGIFTLTFSLGSLTPFLPEMAESLGHGAGISGLMFTVFGAVAAVIMMSPLAQLVDRRGVGLPTMMGGALIGVSFILLMGAESLALIAAACAIFGAGYGFIFPAVSGQVAAATRSGRRGRAYGVFYAAFSLGFVAGAPLGGLLKSAFPHVGGPFTMAFVPALAVCIMSIGAVAWLARGAAYRGEARSTFSGS